MKKITIILSCFNADSLIEEYIDFLLARPILSITNIVAINFPFSHKNPKHVEEILKRHPDIKVIRQDHNNSLYDAWNQAIGLSKTKYVSNLNLDDRVSIEYYSEAFKYLEYYNADVFSSNYVMTSSIGSRPHDSQVIEHISSSRFGDETILEYEIKDMLFCARNRIEKRNIPHCAPVWRRTLHDELGWFNSNQYDFCADFEFWLRVAACGKKLILHKDPMTLFYCAPGTASDKLINSESVRLVDYWEKAWPPENYKPTHLGERHDKLHYCLNLNVIFSSPCFYKHLGNLVKIDKRITGLIGESIPQLCSNKKSKDPIVSVIMPVFNSAGYIKSAIDSVFDQGIEDFELLIIDDASSDGSLELSKMLASRDGRICVLENVRAKGVSGSRNTGLQHACGKYIAFLDADDEYETNALKTRLSYFEANPEVKMVHSSTRMVDENGTYTGVTIVTPNAVTFADAFTNPSHLNAVMVEKSTVGGFLFCEEMTNGEDWLFLAEVLRSGVRSHYVKNAGAIYRIHASSTVMNDMERHEKLVLKVIEWVYSDATGLNVAPMFKQGLSMPQVSIIRGKRYLSLLAWSILNGNVQTCKNLLNKDSFIAFINDLQPNELIDAFRTPFARRFLMPIENGNTKLSLKQKNNIVNVCRTLDLPILVPNLWKVLAGHFAFDVSELNISTNKTKLIGSTSKEHDKVLLRSILANRIVLIMGNGPSSKLIDFKNLEYGHIATVGMNAAYRFWDVIEFRPDYYICMDTVVIRSHAKRISELIEEGRISRFFLRDEFKDIYPKFSDNPNILWFSQAKDRFKVFTTDYVTTGSWAIRWMLHEKFEIIGTIGIDANYVEVLPEAIRIGQGNDLRLEISNTPKYNPNYFFNDYQRAGDLYNIPNDPLFLKQTGALVHVEALRKVAEYVEDSKELCKIYDCSPISNHKIFDKCSLEEFSKRFTLSVITSFYTKTDIDSLKNNISILIKNCSNKYVECVIVLLEGDYSDINEALSKEEQIAFNLFTENGKLIIKFIQSRPSYKSIFDFANKQTSDIVCIINSDILITERAAKDIQIGQRFENNAIYALTRWNRTQNGDFIQGMIPNPPWNQVPLDSLKINERNYYSFDSYVFKPPINVPGSLENVLIGTFGCDTAISAILKISGASVINPCLDIKTIHIDDKKRTYSDENGRSDLIKNIDSVHNQLVATNLNTYNLISSIRDFNLLDRNIAWLGNPKSIDIWHSIFKTIGATSWSPLFNQIPFTFLKISINSGDIYSVSDIILQIPYKIAKEKVFIEWELSGFLNPINIIDLLVNTKIFGNIADILYSYQYQAMIHTDHTNERVATIYSDLVLILKDLLTRPSYNNKIYFPVLSEEPPNRNLEFLLNTGNMFTRLNHNSWAYKHQNSTSEKYWQAISFFPVKVGQTYYARMDLVSDVDLVAKISIARYGNTPYEGSCSKFSLNAGQKLTTQCEHLFNQSHAGLKLQIEILEVFQDQATIDINIVDFNQIINLTPVNKQVNKIVFGPFARKDLAHYDETDCIAELYREALHGQVMIDVGAHHGWAHAPFLDRDWRIFAFEPDNQNRTKLLDRLSKHKNKHLVSLDTRCVSNKPQKGVSFFTSEQSSGISGLSAFHETHHESQKVDITTLTEFFQDRPLPAVDFLKIDTEGHDLFVLQGFPWERGKPAVIECEFEDIKTVPLGYTFHDLARFLVDKGYTVYVSEWHPIIRYGIRHDWRHLMRYPCELADPKGWGNLLAFRDHIDEQALVAAVKKVLKVGGGETTQKPAVPPKLADPAKSAVAIPGLGANLGFRFEPGAHFISIAPNQWRYTDTDAKQKLWVATIDSPVPTAGRSFVGTLRLMADRAMTLNVSLGRHGKSAYEGTSKRIVLSPGLPQIVKLDKKFKLEHQALKLQVEVLDLPGGGTALVTMDTLGIFESQTSVRERLGSDNFNLVTANRLLREGDFGSALAIYLALSQQHPLQMYRDNAVMAAKKAGMTWVEDADQLA